LARIQLRFSVMNVEYLKYASRPKLLTRLMTSQSVLLPLHQDDHEVVDGGGAEEEDDIGPVPVAVEDVRRDHEPPVHDRVVLPDQQVDREDDQEEDEEDGLVEEHGASVHSIRARTWASTESASASRL
jgi:hypothetical protein